MKQFLLAIIAIFFAITSTFGQELEKKWQIEAVKNDAGVNLYNISNTDEFQLENGSFKYDIKSADSLACLIHKP